MQIQLTKLMIYDIVFIVVKGEKGDEEVKMPYLGRDEGPAMAVIRLLQKRGSASIKEIEAALGVTTTAVRLQLSNLQAEGLVAARIVREGVGRPHYEYHLTEKARGLFACYCDELALSLYEELLSEVGAAKVKELLGRVRNRLVLKYRGQVQGALLDQRITQLADLLDQKGILTDVEVYDDGFILREYTCPYHDLALEHREICEMEREVIAHVLDANVSLTRCMVDGHVGCQFNVSHAATPISSTASE
jgi:DeoR family suf operon transcriptional repressor